MKNKCLLYLFISVTCAITSLYPQEGLKLKIGVLRKSGDKITMMKSNDRVKAGDQLRILIQTVNEAYVYAVLVDEKEVTLLNHDKVKSKLAKNKTTFLPSENEFYQVDGNSAKMDILVVGSETPIEQIRNLFASKEVIAKDKWKSYESKLIQETKSNLNQATEKPFHMAGNVRGSNDNYIKNLPVLQGKGKLLRKYEVEVKK